MLPSENEKHHILYFNNALFEYYTLHQVWCETKFRENKLIVTKYVQNDRHWHEHKHISTFSIGQLRHQSATALSRATQAVAAHRCHELWSHTHVAE